MIVHLSDGTSETGSIVIGADGTWSATRAYVQEQASSLARGEQRESDVPVRAEYCTVFGEAPNKNGVPSDIFFEMHTTDLGVQTVTDGDRVRFVLYKRLATPTEARVRYTEKDIEDVAASFTDVNVTPDIKMGEIWPNVNRRNVRLVGQNEGIASHWHTDRVVLVGDAVVTMSAVNALGVSSGLHSAALLASEIHEAVRSCSLSSDKKVPSCIEMGAAFARYQRIRYKGSKQVLDVSYMKMRQMTWSSWKDWFVDRYVMRWGGVQSSIRKQMHSMVSKGQVLRYLPFKDFEARIAWERKPSPVLE